MASLDDLEGKVDLENNVGPEGLADQPVPAEQVCTDKLDDAEDVTAEKLAEAQDKYLRLSAEFDNYRKRTLKERYDLIKTAGEEVIKDLLPVVDDLDRAMEAIASTSNETALAEGVKLIQDKLLGVLKQKGLVEMPVVGQDFDPEVCEAVANIPAAPDMKGKVVEEVQKGYMLNEKIIRYPKVVVGE